MLQGSSQELEKLRTELEVNNPKQHFGKQLGEAKRKLGTVAPRQLCIE
jgi:hypothetical protein